jgi:hypothetical protein
MSSDLATRAAHTEAEATTGNRDEQWREFFSSVMLVVLLLFTAYVWTGWAQLEVRSFGVYASSHAATTNSRGEVAPAPTSSTDPSTSESSEICKGTPDDPGEAFGCFMLGALTAITVAVKAGMEIVKIIWLCGIIPVVMLLFAVAFYELGEWAERKEKKCKKKGGSWWKKFLCFLTTILKWLSRILAVLSVFAAIASIIACVLVLV